ncbi:MAG TPA: aromatic ring-hydroxylating dioxygenase subunit alpha [Acidimicrobiales bacterium]
MLEETLPASWYRDLAVYECERRAVFSASWLAFAFASQLAAHGAYVADEVAGFPVFVHRGADGRLRGFHNVCLHRAGPLVWDGEGMAANLVCRYHGWAYDAEGLLRSARDFGAEVPAGTCLKRVAVGEWRGIVWVNLDGTAGPLEQWLGTFPSLAEPYPMESYTQHRRVVRRLQANWKTYADNYLEGYHIPLVHPALTRAVDVKRYAVTVHDGGRWHRHDVPTVDAAPTTGAWAFLYPNFALNLYPTGMNVERYLPRGPHQVDVVFDYFFAAADSSEAQASVASSTELMDEDQRIVEAVQRNLDAGHYDTGWLSPRHENGVAAFHRMVRAAVGSVGDR